MPDGYTTFYDDEVTSRPSTAERQRPSTAQSRASEQPPTADRRASVGPSRLGAVPPHAARPRAADQFVDPDAPKLFDA